MFNMFYKKNNIQYDKSDIVFIINLFSGSNWLEKNYLQEISEIVELWWEKVNHLGNFTFRACGVNKSMSTGRRKDFNRNISDLKIKILKGKIGSYSLSLYISENEYISISFKIDSLFPNSEPVIKRNSLSFTLSKGYFEEYYPLIKKILINRLDSLDIISGFGNRMFRSGRSENLINEIQKQEFIPIYNPGIIDISETGILLKNERVNFWLNIVKANQAEQNINSKLIKILSIADILWIESTKSPFDVSEDSINYYKELNKIIKYK